MNKKEGERSFDTRRITNNVTSTFRKRKSQLYM